MKNACYTYFRIAGSFEPDEITKLLGIQPETAHTIGELRRNGTPYDCAEWTCGRCETYDIDVSKMIRKTILPLLDKTDILRRIKARFDVSMYLEIVPTVYPDESTPMLAPSMDIMRFCVETGTELDVDLYIGI